MNEPRRDRHAFLLVALAIGMFGFAFALVPLYTIFCEITGLNGKTAGPAIELERATLAAQQVDREVTIQLLAKTARGMPWEFRPNEPEMRVRVGEMNTTTFYVRNRADRAVTGQAVPSVSPGQAAIHLQKIECFCFEQQLLEAGGEMDMAVSFYVDPDLPPDINELSLSYTMFRLGDAEHEHMASNP